MMRRFIGLAGVALVCLVLWPAAARAQSAIAGTVKDTSGAVLPGVTVEASSDVLIEKTRSVATDGNGNYKIVDLRPGTYVVVFTLPGFQTVRRENVDLPSEFTATINADLKVGSVEETITVTATSPVVDVTSAAHVQVLDRESIDNLPTGRTIQGIGQMVVGISLSLPDVGGSRAAMQTYMSVRGNSAANNTVLVDGMVVNGLEANGAVQSYFNDAMSQEMSYQTSGIDASVSSGGVKLNMIPKDGGNKFSGTTQLSYRPGAWQGDNLTQRLKTAGLAIGNSTEYIYDLSGAEGGPIAKDRLWFFATARDYRTNNGISNTYFDNGRKGTDYNYIRDGLGRFTYQLSSKHRIAGYYDRISKYRGHDMQSLYDPETAALIWTSPNYSTGQIKLTSTLTSRLLLEGGWALNVERRNTEMQPGVDKEVGTPEWYAGAARTQSGTTLGAVAVSQVAGSQWPKRYSYTGSLSYITGSHHIKTGLNGTYGSFFHSSHANGDLYEEFANVDTSAYLANGGPIAFSSPVSVVVRNTPLNSEEDLTKDLGIYAQDTWTMKRLSVSAGVRWETLNSQVAAQTSPAGRFVPARTAALKQNLPDWTDWAPRFQAVYDVFGNSKTALKYSVNKYAAAQTTTIASGLNPLASKTARINWTDLNGDGIAQGQRTWNADGTAFTDCVYLTPGCEIQLSRLASNFGLLSDAGSYNGAPRPYSIEHGLELQHELFPRVSVTGSYYHGSFKNLTTTINRAITPADFTPVQVFNPVDGKPFTVYNESTAALGRASDNITFVDPDQKDIFNSYGAEFRARIGKGATLFGGMTWSRERTTSGGSGTPATVNCTVGRLQDPNQLRFCDEFNLEDGSKTPYTKDFRLNGSYPLPWYGLMFSGTYQNNDGGSVAQTYTISNSTKYPDGSNTFLAAGVPVAACPAANCAGQTVFSTLNQSTITPRLRPTKSVRGERLNQIDLKISKTFKVGGVTVSPNFEAFNVNNSDKVITYASTSYALAGGAYLRPNSIVQGRIIGVGTSVRW
jgi:hypothetical protein